MKNAVLGSFTPGLPGHAANSACRYRWEGEEAEMYARFTHSPESGGYALRDTGVILGRKIFKRLLKAAGYQFWVDDNEIIIIQKRRT